MNTYYTVLNFKWIYCSWSQWAKISHYNKVFLYSYIRGCAKHFTVESLQGLLDGRGVQFLRFLMDRSIFCLCPHFSGLFNFPFRLKEEEMLERGFYITWPRLYWIPWMAKLYWFQDKSSNLATWKTEICMNDNWTYRNQQRCEMIHLHLLYFYCLRTRAT